MTRSTPADNQPGHRPDRDQGKPTGTDPAADRGTRPATVRDQLRVGAGFPAHDRAAVVDRLSALDPRLQGHPAEAVELELSVKDRDGRDPRVTLGCRIAGRPRLVATSSHRDRTAALVEVRDNLRRQLDDADTRREPRNNRHLRQPRPDRNQPPPPEQPPDGG
jgi:ribosome-associated translation inhibitor RaiA